jgi:chromosome partitioning protein
MQHGGEMIVVVGGIKGGTGKTTLATNLVVLRSSQGKKVLLVDADEQRSASDWAEQREGLGLETKWATVQLAGKSVFSQLQKMGQDYDDVIVDVGGRDTTSQRSALAIADVFLVPFKPRSLDIWTIGGVKKMIAEIKAINPKLACYAVVNQADAKGSDNEDAQSVLSECPDLKCVPVAIGQRKAFSNAAADGLAVMELKSADKKALCEIKTLHDLIYR